MHLVILGAIAALVLVVSCQAIYRSGYKRGYGDGYQAGQDALPRGTMTS